MTVTKTLLITNINFRDYITGFSIYKAMDLKNPDLKYTLKGYSRNFSIETKVIVTGEEHIETNPYTNIKEYIIDINTINVSIENSFEFKKALMSTLGEMLSLDGAGISENHVEKIIKKFGDKALVLTMDDFDELLSLKLKPKRISTKEDQKNFCLEIIEKISEENNFTKLFNFLIKFGGRFKDAKVLSESKVTLQALMENPYNFIDFLSFYLIDKIAKNLNFSVIDLNRVRALLIYTFKKLETNDTYSYFEDIEKYANKISKGSDFGKAVPACLLKYILKTDEYFIYKKDNKKARIYSRNAYTDETIIADKIKHYNFKKESLYNLSPEDIKLIESKIGLNLNTEQKDSLKLINTTGVKILTGGPGTGKTTLTKAIIEACKLKGNFENNDFALIAPTGRASKRMSELTFMDTSTIHYKIKLLDENEKANEIIEEPIVIIDECSMINTALMSKLLLNIQNASLIILIGDTDQLPPIGHGTVLLDLIKSNAVETYRLKQVNRQKGNSSIISTSLLVKEGNSNLTSGPDFSLKALKDFDIKLAAKKYKQSLKDYQILLPVKSDELGVVNINKKIQESLSPLFAKKLKSKDYYLMQGDKIMTTANKRNEDGSLKFANGSLGVITKIDFISKEIFVAFFDNPLEEIRLTPEETYRDVSLAYAITIHKFQGSECDNVTIVFPNKKLPFFSNRLLYTGITRAKKSLELFIDKEILEVTVANKDLNKKTSLDELFN